MVAQRLDRGPRLVAEPGRDDDLDLDEQVAGRLAMVDPATADSKDPAAGGASGDADLDGVTAQGGDLDGGTERGLGEGHRQIEGEVVAVALDVISKGECRLVRFSYDDESAFSVGLTCGGTIDIFIEPMDW